MPRALIVTEAPVVPEPYRLGLLACGFSVVDEIDDPQRLVKRAVAIEPEVIVIASQTPSQKLFESTRALDTHAPHAVMLFTAAIDHASIVAETGSTVLMVTHDVDEAVLLSDRVVMMTNGPSATIGEILEVGLARPRDRLTLANDVRYMGYRRAVLEFLYQKQLREAA